jgi:hypothetical protein
MRISHIGSRAVVVVVVVVVTMLMSNNMGMMSSSMTTKPLEDYCRVLVVLLMHNRQ